MPKPEMTVDEQLDKLRALVTSLSDTMHQTVQDLRYQIGGLKTRIDHLEQRLAKR